MNDNPFSLIGKTILVTGASSGIGQATAIACSQLGATLVITGRDATRLQSTLGQLVGEGHRHILAELTSERDLERLVASVPELNGVVLCAGKLETWPLMLSSKERFADVFGVNFTAPVELMRQLIKARKVCPGSSVVFVSSCAGMCGGTAVGEGMYGASKAALSSVMRYFAKEFSPQRIRFNAVNPGVVDTPFIHTPLRTQASPEAQAAALAKYPLGRYGEPRDIAYGIIYLLSDAANWVTGQQLVIDGGLTI